MAGPLKSGKVKSKVNLSKKNFAIVVAEWNEEITEALYEGAVSSLIITWRKKRKHHSQKCSRKLRVIPWAPCGWRKKKK